MQRGAFQELSTVEQRLKEQDTIIVSMERQHSEEIQRLKEIIKEKHEGNILLQEVPIPNPPFLLLRDRNFI